MHRLKTYILRTENISIIINIIIITNTIINIIVIIIIVISYDNSKCSTHFTLSVRPSLVFTIRLWMEDAFLTIILCIEKEIDISQLFQFAKLCVHENKYIMRRYMKDDPLEARNEYSRLSLTQSAYLQ